MRDPKLREWNARVDRRALFTNRGASISDFYNTGGCETRLYATKLLSCNVEMICNVSVGCSSMVFDESKAEGTTVEDRCVGLSERFREQRSRGNLPSPGGITRARGGVARESENVERRSAEAGRRHGRSYTNHSLRPANISDLRHNKRIASNVPLHSCR